MSKDDLLSHKYRPVVLIVLDGWGVAGAQEGNAIHLAKTPFFDELVAKYPALAVVASGEAVGLPAKEPGNGRSGHLTLGAGRAVPLGLEYIKQSISDKSFFKNKTLATLWRQLKKSEANLHLVGTLSAALEESAFEALLLAAKRKKLKPFLHLIVDQETNDSLVDKLSRLDKSLSEAGGALATLMNDEIGLNLKRTAALNKKAQQLLVAGIGQKASKKTLVDGSLDLTTPLTFVGSDNQAVAPMRSADGVIFFDYEPRLRNLVKVLSGVDANENLAKVSGLKILTLNHYEIDLPVEVIFPDLAVKETLSEILSHAGLKQLKISDSAKSAELNYFFNGGHLAPWPGEERLVLALKPEAHRKEFKDISSALAKEATENIKSGLYDFIAINLSAADEVGHSGDLALAQEAVTAVDQALKRIVKTVVESGGLALITADHGQAEEMIDWQLDEVRPLHTSNPVPFVVVANGWEGYNLGVGDAVAGDLSLLPNKGDLADVAPTILKLMGLSQPSAMTGHSLL